MKKAYNQRYAPFSTSRLLLHVILLLTLLPLVADCYNDNENIVYEYNHPRNCKYSEYFDPDNFLCVACDVKKNLIPDVNGLACVCNDKSRKIGNDYDSPRCEACPYGTIITSDKKSCIPCRRGVENFTCDCAVNEVKVEREFNGELLKNQRCIQCSDNSYPSQDGLRCIACNNTTTTSHVNCACPLTTHVRIDDHCFHKHESDVTDVRSTYLVQYANDNVDSYYFRKELRLSMYLCKDGDRTACERLANMCALTLTDKSIPCKVAKTKQSDGVWRFYETDGGPVVTNDEIIPLKYSLNKNDNNNHINFTIVTFSLNGELKYVDSPNLFCTFLSSVRFGINVHMECKVYAKELQARETNFYVPYLLYGDKGKIYLNALPVYSKGKNWAPIKKFFLVDTVTSYKAIPNLIDDTFKRDDELSILRYMKSMEIRIKVQNDREGGRIYTPTIRIEYDELKKQDLQDNKQVVIEYRVTFVLLRKHSHNVIEISIGILSSFAVAYSALKAWSYCKRNFNGVLTIGVVVWFFVYCLGAVSNVLLLVCASACIYTFVFYKGQTVLHMLLPAHNVERKIYIYTVLALGGKIIEVLALIYRQRSISVFFMDWEQPRSIQKSSNRYDSPHTSLKKLYGNRFESEAVTTTRTTPQVSGKRRDSDAPAVTDADNETSREQAATPTNDDNVVDSGSTDDMERKHAAIIGIDDNEDETTTTAVGDDKTHRTPVSVWRTYFVANEWFKIQTKRRISIALQITFTLFMLEIVGLKYWTQAIPELQIDVIESHKTTEKSFTLRYGVGALVYVVCYCVQWIVSVIFYERYVKNRLQHFVDLCSVANVSVFIFAYDYYGYYIHGRSVHGYADTDLETLINDLKKEENNLCAHRGLVPGTTNQTFVASLSSSFREIYQKLLDMQNTNENKLRRDVLASLNWEKCLKVHTKIKKFLTAFVDHCFKDLDYTIKERLLLEKLCDIEMNTSDDQSTFYIDNNNTFDRVIFYGNEWTLGTFEIAIFVFSQAVAKDYILACIATLIVSQLLAVVSRVNGKQNLANKTLIDERFLM